MTTIASRSDAHAIRKIGCAVRNFRSRPDTATRLAVFLWTFALWSVGASTLALADGSATPYAAVEIEHDTNVFDVSEHGPAPVYKGGSGFADSFLGTRAGIDGVYFLDQQKFFGTAEFRRFEYDHFTELDHNEELFDGGLKWKLSQVFDGKVEYKHERRMVQFQDLATSTAFILETENTGTAAFNVHVTPEWLWETVAKDHVLDSPRLEVPGLSLHEESVLEGVKYLGVSNLTAGLEGTYLKGNYSHDPTALNPNYHQFGVALAATYIVSGLTNFIGNLGYTNRTDPTNSGVSGVTGSIGYQHSLTGKTSINLQLTRALNTYVTTGGNEIDTTAAAMVNWQATYKLLVRAGYSYTNSKYPQAPNGGISSARVDHFSTGTVDLTYQVLHWLSIRPYARYQARHSNEPVFAFDGNTVGVELLFKQLRPPQR